MTHNLSSACAETILSYHISLQQNCFTYKLEPVTSLLCGCVVVCVLCGLFFVCFLFGFVFGVFFAFCSLCFGFCSWNVWKFDTLCETTLWVRVKRHAIHHWLYSLCTEDMWKVTARSHGRGREHSTYWERILYVAILCHNILLVFGLAVSDIRMMSLISVDQWLWYMDQFYIFYSGFDLSLVWLIAWAENTYIGLALELFIMSSTLGRSFSPSDENTATNSWRRV